jgi:hypothetical protein
MAEATLKYAWALFGNNSNNNNNNNNNSSNNPAPSSKVSSPMPSTNSVNDGPGDQP